MKKMLFILLAILAFYSCQQQGDEIVEMKFDSCQK